MMALTPIKEQVAIMKHTQSVLPVDLNEDLRDERADYLGILQLIAGIASVLLYVSLGQLDPSKASIQPQGFLILAACTGLSYLLLKVKRVELSAYTFIIGLIVCFGLQLSFTGPNMIAYTLLILPVGVASLVLHYDDLSTVTAMVSIAAILFPSVAIGFGPSIVPAIIPIGIYAGIAAMFYAKNFQADERIRWTLDNQRKDNRRAEMFYDQSEQLQKAYLEVQHYSSKLELVNKQL